METSGSTHSPINIGLPRLFALGRKGRLAGMLGGTCGSEVTGVNRADCSGITVELDRAKSRP